MLKIVFVVSAKSGPFFAVLVLIAAPPTAPAFAKPSCGKGGALGATTGTAGGGQFKISVPATYNPAQPIPLLLALHGDEGTPDYIYSAFLPLQKSSNGAFILVAPKAPYGGGSWYQATSQHVTFVNAVLSALLSQYNIDQDRIWITGWSGGSTFLGYYAILRQDVFAAVAFHMGGGGGGSYAPPAGSCLIPARFVIGDQDFLYSLAKQLNTVLTSKGHQTVWIELPGVGHTFQPQTLPETWSWLQAKSLCGKTTPGSCGGTLPGDTGPSSRSDARPPSASPLEAGSARPDGGAPPSSSNEEPNVEIPHKDDPRGALREGCTFVPGGASAGGPSAPLAFLVLVLLLVPLVRKGV